MMKTNPVTASRIKNNQIGIPRDAISLFPADPIFGRHGNLTIQFGEHGSVVEGVGWFNGVGKCRVNTSNKNKNTSGRLMFANATKNVRQLVVDGDVYEKVVFSIARLGKCRFVFHARANAAELAEVPTAPAAPATHAATSSASPAVSAIRTSITEFAVGDSIEAQWPPDVEGFKEEGRDTAEAIWYDATVTAVETSKRARGDPRYALLYVDDGGLPQPNSLHMLFPLNLFHAVDVYHGHSGSLMLFELAFSEGLFAMAGKYNDVSPELVRRPAQDSVYEKVEDSVTIEDRAPAAAAPAAAKPQGAAKRPWSETSSAPAASETARPDVSQRGSLAAQSKTDRHAAKRRATEKAPAALRAGSGPREKVRRRELEGMAEGDSEAARLDIQHRAVNRNQSKSARKMESDVMARCVRPKAHTPPPV